MSQKSSCPVCGRQGLAPDCANCPQCDSDLTCFQVLDALSAAPKTSSPVSAAQKKSFPWFTMFSGAVLFVLLVFIILNIRGSFAALYQKVVTLPVKETGPSQQVVSQADGKQSDDKIHIDAQIRILDDRHNAKKRQSSDTAAAEKNKHADQASLPEATIKTQDTVSEGNAVAQQNTLSETEAPQKVLTENEDTSSARPEQKGQPTEISESTTKQAATTEAAASKATELPVLKATRKRWIRATAQGYTRNPRVASKPAGQATSSTIFFHQAQDGETVWELAEHFYGEGKYYPLIMELNPNIVQGRIQGTGKKVKLLTDRKQAVHQYQEHTEQRDGLLLWKHKVQPGETWQSLYARFFPPRYSGLVFYPGEQKVAPGKTVNIVLR
jgi:hypothetical protein